jgi:hypothetical protein
MGKPSIYSKTRSQLRRDLAQAGIDAKAMKKVEALVGSILAGESDAKSLNEGIREESG